MIRFFIAVRGHRLFQAAVITVIVISAIAAGSRTYSLPNSTVIILDVLDYSITIFFVIELLIRFGGEGRKLDFLNCPTSPHFTVLHKSYMKDCTICH